MSAARKPENHRTRVGAERRQRMRAHLLEVSLAVFADQGVDASIDDIIAAAKVSRGTFYNYFPTNQDILAALGDALAKELIGLVESTVVSYGDPVQRMGVGVRLFLHVVRDHPRFGSFLWRTAFRAATAQLVLQAYLPRHIEEGIAAQSFSIESAETGLHVVAGIVLAGTFALSNMSVARSYPEQLVRSALLALGASRKHIDKVLALPLPQLAFPADSLLARTQVRKKA